MKIFFVSSEVVPFAKTGGLADVAGALPKALQELGHEVKVFLPRYKKVDRDKFRLKPFLTGLEVQIGNSAERFDILEAKIPGSIAMAYFVENERYFGGRDELYGVAGKDYEDNLERFTLFCKAAVEFLKKSEFRPDVVHCNDWQSALLIAYLKVWYKDDPFFKKTATVYSIHNMGYQGTFPKDKLWITGMGWDQFVPDKLEFWDKLSLTKAGFVYADVINTVSETYAEEIQTPEYGHGLDGLMRARRDDLYGIINGIDYEIWDPEEDAYIPINFSSDCVAEKSEIKLALQKEMELPQSKTVPLIGIISRLADQKGFDILASDIEKIMHLKCQMAILGLGEPKYHELLKEMRQKYPEHISVRFGFDDPLAHRIYAGSDMFLMPSRYEPCGLGQLISFKYGTVPIVRKTGGLADTVTEFYPATGKGDGFTFEEYTAKALHGAITRAVGAFSRKASWKKLVEKVMEYDYSWGASAKKYVALYRKALSKIGIRISPGAFVKKPAGISAGSSIRM